MPFYVYYLCNIASIPAADTGGASPGGRPNPEDGAVPGGGPNGPAALIAAAIWSTGDRSLGSNPTGLIPENCDYNISHAINFLLKGLLRLCRPNVKLIMFWQAYLA